MAHAYTPGLRVTAHAHIRRERRLPLRGEVLVERGATVGPETVVARTELPGNVQTVNLAARLAVDPAKVAATLARPLGSPVRKGDVVASARTLFGLVQNRVEAPMDGTLESVSSVTGQLLLREAPMPVEVNAYVAGAVTEVFPGEGVAIEARGALLQGIFGVGGETFGALAPAVAGPTQALEVADVRPEHRGRVVVGGAFVSYDVLQRARDVGVAAIVVGGFDDADLRRLLGRDLGVAVTGTEELGLTLVLTEGFGRIAMAARTWALLVEHRGQVASVSGATQIRAGVLRPEIVVPHGRLESGSAAAETAGGGALEPGAAIRVIRPPWFGRLGRVVELPAELRALDTEAHVRVLVAELEDDGARVVVPRANVERIAD